MPRRVCEDGSGTVGGGGCSGGGSGRDGDAGEADVRRSIGEETRGGECSPAGDFSPDGGRE